MKMVEVTGNPAELIVEQLAASGVKYVFNNSGSAEALFFDALHQHPDVDGVLALHEGSVVSMASGFTQAKLDPGVAMVHLGAGLAQSLGQFINTFAASLPVVLLSFVDDTGSFSDRVGLNITHDFGLTSISAPFTKASWSVIEPEELPHTIERALRMALTPPVGPVHVAIYVRVLEAGPINARISHGRIEKNRAGYPSSDDIETLLRALHDAKRPVIYAGDGVWKSNAEAELVKVAEHFGALIYGYQPGIPNSHHLHCGDTHRGVPMSVKHDINPDCVIAIGVRHPGPGTQDAFSPFFGVDRILSVGSDSRNLKGIPGIDVSILADERRTLDAISLGTGTKDFLDRRTWAQKTAKIIRDERKNTTRVGKISRNHVRPWKLAEALDMSLERMGGGLVMIEQYAVPMHTVGSYNSLTRNEFIYAAGGSEGYGVGATIGLKLASPDKPVVGLVGDGSLYYADSGMWTAAHHEIPVLYIVSNNGAYGIVANAFERDATVMSDTGEYAGVVLGGIDPLKIAQGFGIDGMEVDDESRVEESISHGLQIVEKESRPFLLNVKLPLGLPAGGKESARFRFEKHSTEI